MKTKTINGWTRRKMINHIKREFRGKSISEVSKRCRYRIDVRKCAVGLFIPDSAYSPDMEGDTVRILGDRIEKYMPLNIDKMQALQTVHDTSNPGYTLEEMLEWIKLNVV